MEIGVKSSQIIGVAVGDRNDIAGVYLARAAVGPMLEIGNWKLEKQPPLYHCVYLAFAVAFGALSATRRSPDDNREN